MPDQYLCIEDIKRIPESDLPIIVYCDGGSLFGWLIRRIDKSMASHLQALAWIDGEVKICSQGLTFTTHPIDQMAGYNSKLIYNPVWTDAERKRLTEAIKYRLALPWYKRLYDVPGVIGEALHVDWLQVGWFDFCSEFIAIRLLALVDPAFAEWLKDNPSPTPREVNLYCKRHNPPYKVYARYSPDDEEKATDGTREVPPGVSP